MRRDAHRLFDIQTAIDKILRQTRKGKTYFFKDEMIQVWVVHHLEIIGEAARAVSDDVRERFPDVPWTMLSGMRNRLAHEYFRIDQDIVWEVVDNELPKLRRQIVKIRKSLTA